MIKKLLRVLLIIVVALLVLGTGVWATMAIKFSNLPWEWLRLATAAVFVLGSIALFVFIRPWRRALLVYTLVFAVVLTWYYLIPASNDRDWQPDVARTPTIEFNGDIVTVRNVRNCVYRSETDYDVHYEDREYELSKLQSVDLIMSYWGPRDICHTLLTFCFEGEAYLCCSIETRKERGEGFSAVQGCFRKFELIYIFADERDLIGLRTDFRKEEVYLYHLPAPPERARTFLRDYARSANTLAAKPAWYNAITDSCSMGIIYHSWAAEGALPFQPRMLLNGHWDEYAYEAGRLDRSIPFETLRERSRINGKASSTDPDFSTRIRAGLPPAAAAGS